MDSTVQTSGLSQNDFANPQIYTVTALDGHIFAYEVSVSNSIITSYSFKEVNSTFSIDTEENFLWAEGLCSFDEFEDDGSEYTINGTIEYSVSGNMNRNSDEMELEIVFDLTYEGGNIESIEFIMDDENMQSGEPPELTVNGRSFQFKEDLKSEVFRLLKDRNVI